MLTFMWSRTGSGQKKEAFEGINAALELLVGHHLLFRGDNKRNIELSDATYTIQENSRGNIPVLGFQLTHSKTMGPDGRPRCMGACRSKDVRYCMISSVAFSLWFRFDFKEGSLSGRNFPDFLDKKSWYPIKLLFSTKTATLNKPISYNHENTLIKKCLEVIGLISKKTTYLSRKSNAQSAYANQINEEQIMNAGHCMSSATIKFYLSPFPFDFILQSAGFKNDEPYFIARDIDPPHELKKMIFPWLEEWIEKVKNRPDQSALDPRERDGTAPKFLHMLDQFRSIILQDLAVWMDIAPDSIFCKHEITRLPAFANFREEMRRRTDERTIFSDLLENFNQVLQISNPFVQLVKKMKAGFERGMEMVKVLVETLNSKIDVLADLINRRDYRFDDQSDRMDALEQRQETVVRLLNILATEQRQAREASVIVSSQITELNMSLRGTSLAGSVPAMAPHPMQLGFVPPMQLNSTAAMAPQVMEEIVERANNNVLSRTASQVTAPPIFNPEDPRYSLGRNRSVMESLEEWYVLTSSFMCISERDRLFAVEWRRSRNKQTYKRKKVLINFLTYLLPKINDGSLSMKQLGLLVEKYRNDNGFTLPSLTEKLERRSQDNTATTVGESCKEEVAASVVALWSTLPDSDKEALLLVQDNPTS